MGGFIDMTGKKYGMLTVIERTGTANDKQALWKCKCDCGNFHTSKGRDLRNGKVKSCGCMSHKWTNRRKTIHGKSDTRLYSVWLSMKNRCYRENIKGYENYGGRGIRVCDEWLQFKPFMEWAYANGYDENAPRGQCTLDRIDVNGNYEPSNCRWVSVSVQANNRRNNRLIEFDGQIRTSKQWSEITGISRANIENRIDNLGWSIEKALTKKPNTCRRIAKDKKEDWTRFYAKIYQRKLKGRITNVQFKEIIEREVENYVV